MTHVVGRLESNDLKLTGYIGREYEKHKGDIILGERIFLDLNEPHMITICGKRGYGKSYTLAVIAEELMSLEHNIRKNLSGIIIDTMGIYWCFQVKSKNNDLLKRWELENENYPVTVYYPSGLEGKYKDHKNYFHKGFKLYPSEISISDWLYLFDIKETQAQASVLDTVITKSKEKYGKFYSLRDVILELEKSNVEDNIKNALNRKLEQAESWGIFSEEGEEVEEIIKGNTFVVLDLSGAGTLSWNVRTTIASILLKKIFGKRSFARCKEEIAKIENERIHLSIPLIWLFIDEAHLFAPSGQKTAATEPLLEWVRQGRRPGLSIVMATQQPGALDNKLLSQCDTLIIHRVTAGQDSKAVEAKISEIHGAKSFKNYMKNLPKKPGFALIMNDKTEEIIPVIIRPRKSWDAGGSAKLEEYI